MEWMWILKGAWKVPSEKFYPKMKYLDVARLDSNFSADQFTKTLPNLETLKIDEEPGIFLVTLLSKLKQLKTLHLRLDIWTNFDLERESALQCFRQHGKHLIDVYVSFDYQNWEYARLGPRCR
jgi:hypothetical protein